MKSIVRWAISNAPAMNIIMVAVILVGAFQFDLADVTCRDVTRQSQLEIQ